MDYQKQIVREKYNSQAAGTANYEESKAHAGMKTSSVAVSEQIPEAVTGAATGSATKGPSSIHVNGNLEEEAKNNQIRHASPSSSDKSIPEENDDESSCQLLSTNSRLTSTV